MMRIEIPGTGCPKCLTLAIDGKVESVGRVATEGGLFRQQCGVSISCDHREEE